MNTHPEKSRMNSLKKLSAKPDKLFRWVQTTKYTILGAPQLQLCERSYFPFALSKVRFVIAINESSVMTQIIAITSAHSAEFWAAQYVQIFPLTKKKKCELSQNFCYRSHFISTLAVRKSAEWADVIAIICVINELSFIAITKPNFERANGKYERSQSCNWGAPKSLKKFQNKTFLLQLKLWCWIDR